MVHRPRDLPGHLSSPHGYNYSSQEEILCGYEALYMG